MSDIHKTGAIAVITPREPDARMSPVVATGMEILRQHPSPDALEKLLAVQREWEANEARKAFAASLVALKRDLPTVIKRDQAVDFTGNSGKRTYYTHASLAGVMDAITHSLTQHGFSLAWRPSTTDNKVSVTCRLTHMAGHFDEATISAPIDNSGNKSPAQGVASTITLLQRYTALSLLGIATADMQEPTGEQQQAPADPAQIDSQLNLRVAGNLKKYGRTPSQAEQLVGRKVPDWTRADLDHVKAWAKNAHRPECALHQGGKACDAGCDTEIPPPPSGD